MLKSVHELKKIVQNVKPKRMAVVFAHDEFVMEAICQAMALAIVQPILIGDQIQIEAMLQKNGVQSGYQTIHELDPIQATKVALDLVNQGEVDILMKGLIDTKDLLKGVVNKEYGIRSASLLSHVGLVSYPNFERVLFATDGAMNIQPTVEEKRMIIENAVWLAHRVGYIRPIVGLVSAVEKVNPKIQSTVEADSIIQYYQANPPSDFLIGGPFAIDNLVSMESVKHKNLDGPIAGKADILLFPNLDGGNIFYKTSMFLAGGVSAGMVIGAKVPIVLTSRADTSEVKLYSILLAVVSQDGLLASRY